MKPILMETAQGAITKTAELTHQSVLNFEMVLTESAFYPSNQRKFDRELQ